MRLWFKANNKDTGTMSSTVALSLYCGFIVDLGLPAGVITRKTFGRIIEMKGLVLF